MSEKAEDFKQNKTIKKVLRYIGKYWFYVMLSLLFAMITVALTLYIPVLTGEAVDVVL